VMGLAFFGVNAAGGAAGSMYLSYCQSFSNSDPAFPGYYVPTSPGGLSSLWGLIVTTRWWYPSLMLLVNPLTAASTPSGAFITIVAQQVDEPPAIIAMPPRIYCVVGREAVVHYDALMQRDYRRTNFRATWGGAIPAGSGAQEEKIRLVPTGAGSIALTLDASRGDILSSTAGTTFLTVAASAAPGTKVIHLLGDSLIQGEGLQNAMRVIEASQAVTALTFIGSHGTSGRENDGYSGTSLGSFRTSTLNGAIANPFWNGSDFDYPTWRAGAFGTGKPDANYFVIEAGGVDVGSPTSDAAAIVAANNWATTCEAIVANVRATLPSCAIVIHTKEAGPFPEIEDPAPVYGPMWRVRRNWKILAAKQISQFGGRTASGIYVDTSACAVDPGSSWNPTFRPRNVSITRDMVTYTTYAAMIAASNNAGTVLFCSQADIQAYFIKIGNGANGLVRPATERDGFITSTTDGVHFARGHILNAEALWALIKNVG
jgi:hypothetical protein